MDLAPLIIDPAEARTALEQYERQIAAERTEEDKAIAAGYRAAARGLSVISLRQAFQTAGTMQVSRRNQSGVLPRLAVARANATECWVRAPWGDHAWVFRTERSADNHGALVGRATVRVPWVDPPEKDDRLTGYTIVPIIPPQHRPKRTRMKGFHILWEVEEWVPEPARDPALIRHIRGDLWAVMATWDLTDLERAVLSQRAR